MAMNSATADDTRPRRSRGLGWLWLLLLLAAAALVLAYFLTRGDDGGSTGGSGGSGASSGATLTAGGANVLGSVGNLARFRGKAVDADGIRVQEAVNDKGFWLGTSKQNRVFVEEEFDGPAPVTVQTGDTVSFTGTIEKNIEAEAYGVRASEGAAQLRRQGYHVRVKGSDVKVG
jgi:plastocyanin